MNDFCNEKEVNAIRIDGANLLKLKEHLAKKKSPALKDFFKNRTLILNDRYQGRYTDFNFAETLCKNNTIIFIDENGKQTHQHSNN